MIALCVMYIPNCMIFYFCITWLPTYLRQRHGFDATSLGIFSGLPLIVSMPGDLLGGWSPTGSSHATACGSDAAARAPRPT